MEIGLRIILSGNLEERMKSNSDMTNELERNY